MSEAPHAPPLSERVTALLARTSYRLMQTPEERDRIFRLRYDAYLREGAIAHCHSARVIDEFDAAPNAWLFGVYLDGVLAASIRIHVLSREAGSSPALETFPDALEGMVARGKVIIDPNRFVADNAASHFFPELPYLTLRLPFMAGRHFGADIVTATVRREHAAFYRRVLRFNSVCPPRPYPTLLKPLGLLTVNYPREAPKVLERYPFFAARSGEASEIFKVTSPASRARADA